MNPKRKRKLFFIIGFISVLSLGASLVLYALKQNINLFYTPTQIKEATLASDQTVRLGGYVKKGSIVYSQSGEQVEFRVTDRVNELQVQYQGVLPNLFKEGQTVIVTGHLDGNTIFNASEVLAKHDEKYIPKGLAVTMKIGENDGT